MSSPFAFAFFSTQWRPDLAWQLQVCLHSLDTRGGKAATYPRYLVFLEEPTRDLLDFAARNRLIVRQEKRLTYRQIFPNKALLCKVPDHQAVCFSDLDIVFLKDPTPMLEEAALTGKVQARLDLGLPYSSWPRLPTWGQRWVRGIAERIWQKQYVRFSRRNQPVAQLRGYSGELQPPYFQAGLTFVPGRVLDSLGEAWWHVSKTLLRDHRFRRPYTSLFTPYFYEQMSLAIGLHRAEIPFSLMQSIYNYLPLFDSIPTEDRNVVADDVVIGHMVLPVRSWIDPEDSKVENGNMPELLSKVRAIVHEVLDQGGVRDFR